MVQEAIQANGPEEVLCGQLRILETHKVEGDEAENAFLVVEVLPHQIHNGLSVEIGQGGLGEHTASVDQRPNWHFIVAADGLDLAIRLDQEGNGEGQGRGIGHEFHTASFL